MDKLVDALPLEGSMPFDEWKTAVLAAGGNPQLWTRAKRQGLLHTTLDEAGNLFIQRGARPQPEPSE